MDFRILDASAFYAGVPFRSSDDCYTTSLVFDEIKHIKKNHGVVTTLVETNRLKIIDPGTQETDSVIKIAKDTGDFSQLSKQDISILALCIKLEGQIITDDFAVSNVAKNIGLTVYPIMTLGIKDIRKWVYYCPGCHQNFSNKNHCPNCGSTLKRKLLKR